MKNIPCLFISGLLVLAVWACAENTADKDATAADASTSMVEKPQQDATSISGVYEISAATSTATVVVNHLEGNNFEFEITTATQSGCTGDLKGKATLADDKVSRFSSDLCNLIFKFYDESVTIEEGSCEAHGMQCGFAGTYEKAM
jgi:uncharacterized protein (UPF0333 family)